MSVAATPTLEVEKLRCIRGERELFQQLSFSLDQGEILQAHGANGSGKTTLIRILAGLTEPESGQINWQGQCINKDRLAYSKDLRYLGHLAGIKLELSPYENLRFATELTNAEQAMPLLEALEAVALYGFEDEPARTLSAGQRRRIGLARLLVSPGRLWLLDEPYTSLDAAGISMLGELLHQHLEKGGMAILASHAPVQLPEKNIKTLQLLT